MSRRAALFGLLVLASLVGVHALCARWLAQVDLMERLLSPSSSTELVLPALFLLLRVSLVCFGPGVLVVLVFRLAWPSKLDPNCSSRPAS